MTYSSTSKKQIEPFWHRLGAISRYPLQSSALIQILFFTLLRLFNLIPFGLLMRVVIAGLIWIGIYRLAVEVLMATAKGKMRVPEFTMDVGDSEGFAQLRLQVLLIGMILVGGFFLSATLGIVVAIIWAVFVAIAIPGATIHLAMTGNLASSLNPKIWVEIITAIGLPYFGVALLCVMYQISGANLESFLLPLMPKVLGTLLSWFITHYVLIVSFHLMGYMVYQYADRLGHEIEIDPREIARANPQRDPDQDLLDQAQSLIQDGKPADAASMLHSHLQTRGGTVLVHDLYRKIMKAQNNLDGLAAHTKMVIPILLAQDNVKRALEIVRESYADNPDFILQAPDDIHRLAQRASVQGQHQLALKMLGGFHQRYPKHPDVAKNYLFAAKLLTDKFDREAQAKALLVQLKTNYPNDPMMPEVDQYLQFLSALEQKTSGNKIA